MKRHSKAIPQTPAAAKPNKRPNHKARLRLNEIAEGIAKAHPEPMTLMHRREKDGELPVRKLPKPLHTLGTIDKAATAMAAWENSDPFSYNRTALYVKQGYIDPKEVIEEMSKRTIARRVAREREVDRAKGV